MDSAEGGVRKHLKLPVGASGGRAVMASAPAHLRTAITRTVAGYGLPVAGGVGGASAVVTAVSSHHVSTVALVSSSAMVVTTVVAHCLAKCFDSYFRPETIRERGTADEARVKVEADAQTGKAREETRQILMRMAIDDPANAARIERMLAREDLVTLAARCGLTGQELYKFGTLLLGEQPRERPEPSPPREGNGVKCPRPVCPQARTGRTRQAPLAQPPTRI